LFSCETADVAIWGAESLRAESVPGSPTHSKHRLSSQKPTKIIFTGETTALDRNTLSSTIVKNPIPRYLLVSLKLGDGGFLSNPRLRFFIFVFSTL